MRKGHRITELSAAQFHAALNITRYLADRKRAGEEIDLSRLVGFRVCKDLDNPDGVIIEIKTKPPVADAEG